MINPYKLWHKRFGHLNYNALPGLQKMITGMLVFSFEHDSICRGCALGKNTKKAYPHNNRKTNDTLDLIHYDLCGPMTSPSMNGCLYYIIFIDDCSRKTWIYFLKTKDESFNKFQDLRILLRIREVDISLFSEQTMEKSLTPTSMMIYVGLLGLRGS
jgi:hypothetical protein